MFKRDASAIQFASVRSADTMAFTLMFAVATANCPFKQSIEAMGILRRRFLLGQYELTDFTDAEKSVMGCAFTGAKYNHYVNIWVKRVLIHNHYTVYHNAGDWEAFWNYCMDELSGMGLVKAAFATQMLFGKMGCIDIHNAREMGYDKAPAGKSKKQRENYLKIQAIKSSEEWWNDWCNALTTKTRTGYIVGQYSGDQISMMHSAAVLGFSL